MSGDRSVTREADTSKWANRGHPLGRSSNHMNEMKYQPMHVPDEGSLDNPMPPLYRAEVRERLLNLGLTVMAQSDLTWRHYYTYLRKQPDDPYEGSKYKAAWEKTYPDMAQQLAAQWSDFLLRFNPVS